MKKFIKYTSRIVLGLLTIFLGLLAYVAYHPDESYHHCRGKRMPTLYMRFYWQSHR